jgi:hypothetical protein
MENHYRLHSSANDLVLIEIHSGRQSATYLAVKNDAYN